MWVPLLLVSGFSYPPPFSDVDPKVHNHDGFYLRLGAGVGSAFSSQASGLGIPSEVVLGGTLFPGFVLGFGNTGTAIPKPESDRDGGQLAFNSWGPFVDYYLDTKRGAHLEASVSFVYGLWSKKDEREAAYGPGWGATLGGGHEWWIADEWSLGFVLRATYYEVTLKGQDSGTKSDVRAFVPALLFAATYH